MATNQCDGCMRGLPIDQNGIHHDEQMFGMVCTADRYKDNNELLKALVILEPHLDLLICYASTISEYRVNGAVKTVRDYVQTLAGITKPGETIQKPLMPVSPKALKNLRDYVEGNFHHAPINATELYEYIKELSEFAARQATRCGVLEHENARLKDEIESMHQDAAGADL